MTTRTRQAHLRATDADGREWKLTWCAPTKSMFGRPLRSRTTYVLSSDALLQAMLTGINNTPAPREDPRQLPLIP